MLFLYSGAGGSPILARQSAPVFKIILSLLILTVIIFLIYVIFNKISKYKNSDKYKQKEINRITTYSDVKKYAKINNLSKQEFNILWNVCSITKCLNINYLLKSNNAVNELFHNAYNLLIQDTTFSDEKLDDFFITLFKIETLIAEYKKIPSTRSIPISTVIFFISETGEQYPFCMIKNNKDFFTVEVPEFIYSSHRKPKTLIRTRFTFKTNDGLSYNFISRIIRYDKTPDDKYLMIIAHTDQLSCQAQRHYKREFFEQECTFTPIRINKNQVKNNDIYIVSEKKYKGKITNISAGGCCIQTNLPIREQQHIGVLLPELGIEETIVGIIKRTRKLPNGLFALHIQFIHLSLKAKNKIYLFVYKYNM